MTAQYEEEQPIKIVFRPLSRETSSPIETTPAAVAERLLKSPITIHVYTDKPDAQFDPEGLAVYLRHTFGSNFTVEFHGEMAQLSGADNDIFISKLAEANLARQEILPGYYQPVTLEDRVNFEKNINQDKQPFLEAVTQWRAAVRQQRPPQRNLPRYDYYAPNTLSDAFLNILPPAHWQHDEQARHVTLVITGRGLGEPDSHGIHMRAGTATNSLAIISTTGLVEAPAPPRLFDEAMYWEFGLMSLCEHEPEKYDKVMKRINELGGLSSTTKAKALREVLADQMLNHNDPRLTNATKGLALGLTLHALGEVYGLVARCSTSNLHSAEPDLTKTCRLHDAHRQEELLKAQIKADGDPEFCQYHAELFALLQKPK